MSFTKEERVALSKTIITVPEIVAGFEKTKEQLLVPQAALLSTDNFNKSLSDKKTILIDAYQNDLVFINGQNRIKISETDIQNSLKREVNNIFFFADVNVSTPSMPNGVWKNFTPLLLTGAVGKKTDETYLMSSYYEEKDIASLISAIDLFTTTYTGIIRVTGQICTAGTPTDTIAPYTAVVDALNDIKDRVLVLKSFIISEKNTSLTNPDTDALRLAERDANNLGIDNLVMAIDTWLSYPDFNSAHGQPNCSSFNSYNPALLAPTKGFDTQIGALKSSLQSRLSFLPIRVAQIEGYLGGVNQDISTGDIVSSSGFYGDRAKIFDLRLNILGGSAQLYEGSLRSIKAIDQQQKTAENALSVYSSLLAVSRLKAQTNGTQFLHVQDASMFSVGQTCYLVSNSQDEISGTIMSISGGMIRISVSIPPTYRPSDGARFYVDLS